MASLSLSGSQMRTVLSEQPDAKRVAPLERRYDAKARTWSQ
eukprot:CAMPEP_0204553256 /NCGR_PEP_ID=MMETSP0661-20131031/27237_1 /ASSEMBLY_ACC=CAM_ASM_000606 /TAXON_ID=109239 /ORGANISM="Alexandrium margalefi, Strain AMGDE01CS-322" /LENGTH=40 /DNA_ID= /DNA_START= /DNA_END= /DNA_ORIENTATION=